MIFFLNEFMVLSIKLIINLWLKAKGVPIGLISEKNINFSYTYKRTCLPNSIHLNELPLEITEKETYLSRISLPPSSQSSTRTTNNLSLPSFIGE
jgi:hypothetical protein